MLELAKRHGQGPVRSADIAATQAIPQRFLENILNELKSSGLVEAHRGPQGGFVLACDPEELTVGRVIRLVDGPLDPVKCTRTNDQRDCPLTDRCSLLGVWQQAKEAVESVYDNVTFADLARQEISADDKKTVDFCI
jgi:Rrf2 family protein